MIFITDTILEDGLKQLLQRNTKLRFGNRVWRSGRIILFKQSGFYIELLLTLPTNKQERFEIPIPYDIIHDTKNSKIYFDYRLKTLTYGKKDLLKLIDKITLNTKKSRFYDSLLEIEIIQDT